MFHFLFKDKTFLPSSFKDLLKSGSKTLCSMKKNFIGFFFFNTISLFPSLLRIGVGQEFNLIKITLTSLALSSLAWHIPENGLILSILTFEVSSVLFVLFCFWIIPPITRGFYTVDDCVHPPPQPCSHWLVRYSFCWMQESRDTIISLSILFYCSRWPSSVGWKTATSVSYPHS